MGEEFIQRLPPLNDLSFTGQHLPHKALTSMLFQVFQLDSSDLPEKQNSLPCSMLLHPTPELVREVRSLLGTVGPAAIAATPPPASGTKEPTLETGTHLGGGWGRLWCYWWSSGDLRSIVSLRTWETDRAWKIWEVSSICAMCFLPGILTLWLQNSPMSSSWLFYILSSISNSQRKFWSTTNYSLLLEKKKKKISSRSSYSNIKCLPHVPLTLKHS